MLAGSSYSLRVSVTALGAAIRTAGCVKVDLALNERSAPIGGLHSGARFEDMSGVDQIGGAEAFRKRRICGAQELCSARRVAMPRLRSA